MLFQERLVLGWARNHWDWVEVGGGGGGATRGCLPAVQSEKSMATRQTQIIK